MKELFRLEKACYSYSAEYMAVADMDLTLQPGRFYAIVGPNGSGKSTLLDMLLGYKEPDSGEVLFRGRSLSSWRRRDLAREMALVPQEFTISFPFTVAETILMGRYPHMPRFSPASSEDWDKVQHVMQQTGIWPYRSRYITELSGGEKQRAVIARALVQETRILLLDEATSNLDIRHGLELLSLIRARQQSREGTVVAVFHDLNQAVRFCDDILFLKDGRLVRMGPVGEAMNEQTLREVFEVRAKIYFEPFLDCPQAVFACREPYSAGETA